MARTVLASLLLGAAAVAGAQERAPAWPQWGGPARNFQVEGASLARSWPDGGPPERWRRTLGEGYTAVLVDDDRLVTMYRTGDREVIIGLDAATGDTRWEHGYDAPLMHDGYFDVWLNAAGPGPYSTPLIADGLVFAVGVNGHFHALDARTGALRWSHDLVEHLGVTDYNAFAASPIAYGRTVIVPLGGSRHGVVAFDRETGGVVWQSDPVALGPGSPQLIAVDGQDQLAVWGQQDVVGLDPRDGTRLWRHPHPNDLGLNVSMPIPGGDQRLFVSSAYSGGSRMLHLRTDRGRTVVDELWHTGRTRLHFSNAVRVGSLVIGSSGDFGPAFLTALDVDTGTERWRDRSFARAHLVAADDALVIVDEDGEIAIATASPDGLEVHAREPLLTPNAWTPPTVAGRMLYVRDRADIAAFDLGE